MLAASNSPDRQPKQPTFDDVISGVFIELPAPAYKNRSYEVDPSSSVKENRIVVKAREAFEARPQARLAEIKDLLWEYDQRHEDRQEQMGNVFGADKIASDSSTLPHWPVGVLNLNIDGFELNVIAKVIRHLIESDLTLVDGIQSLFLDNNSKGLHRAIFHLIGELDNAQLKISWPRIGDKCLERVFGYNELDESERTSPEMASLFSVAVVHGDLTAEGLVDLLNLDVNDDEAEESNDPQSFKSHLTSALKLCIKSKPTVFLLAREKVLLNYTSSPKALCLVLECSYDGETPAISIDHLQHLLNYDSNEVRVATYNYIEKLGLQASSLEGELDRILGELGPPVPQSREDLGEMLMGREPTAWDLIGKACRALAACARPESNAMKRVRDVCYDGMSALFNGYQGRPDLRDGSFLDPRTAYRDDTAWQERLCVDFVQALIQAAPRDQRVADLFKYMCRYESPAFRLSLFSGVTPARLPSGGSLDLVAPGFKVLLKTSRSKQRIEIIKHLLKEYSEAGEQVVMSVINHFSHKSECLRTSGSESAEFADELKSLSDHIAAELDFARNQLSPPGPTA